ncbi:MAG: hypothetical protein ACRCUS_05115 [Anaerovoracaceae bacterium]
MQELRAQQKRAHEELQERQDRDSEEQKFRSAEFDRRIDKVNQTLGAWASNQGAFAEEYFFNAFEQGRTTFFGEKFDEIHKNWKKYEDEYDIVLINGIRVN